MVPEGWEVVLIGDVCSAIIDCVNKTATLADHVTPYKMIRTTNVRNGRVDTENVRYVTSEVFDIWTRRGILQDQDIIFTREAPVGEVGKLIDARGTFLGQRTMVYRADQNMMEQEFLFQSMLGPSLQRQFQIESAGGTVAHIRVPDCSKFKITAPSLPEQRKIAEILSTWDRAIDKTEALLANARTQKRALMQQLLTGKHRFPAFEERPWTDLQLGEIGATFNGLTGKTKDDFGSGQPFITYLNIFQNSRIDLTKGGRVTLKHNERQNRVQFGDIFFTTSSETPHEVGMSSVLLDEPNDVYLNSFCFGLRLHDFNTLLPRYGQFMFRGQDFRRELHRLAQGATRYNLSKVNLMKTPLRLPSIEEQECIADVLEAAQVEETTRVADLTKLHTEKKALMQQLLTGKRRVVIDA